MNMGQVNNMKKKLMIWHRPPRRHRRASIVWRQHWHHRSRVYVNYIQVGSSQTCRMLFHNSDGDNNTTYDTCTKYRSNYVD